MAPATPSHGPGDPLLQSNEYNGKHAAVCHGLGSIVGIVMGHIQWSYFGRASYTKIERHFIYSLIYDGALPVYYVPVVVNVILPTDVHGCYGCQATYFTNGLSIIFQIRCTENSFCSYPHIIIKYPIHFWQTSLTSVRHAMFCAKRSWWWTTENTKRGSSGLLSSGSSVIK